MKLSVTVSGTFPESLLKGLAIGLVVGSSAWGAEIRETQRMPSPLSASLELKYTSGRAPGYVWRDGKTSGAYGAGGALAMEWLPLGRWAGKWTVGLEAAGTAVSRSGRRLNLLPLSGSVGYRFDYVENQVFVPFVRGGPRFTYYHENPGRSGRFWSWTWTAGAALCLNGIERNSSALLDAQYGVNATYLVLEYSQSTPWESEQNFPRSEQFYAGLRFEM